MTTFPAQLSPTFEPLNYTVPSLTPPFLSNIMTRQTRQKAAGSNPVPSPLTPIPCTPAVPPLVRSPVVGPGPDTGLQEVAPPPPGSPRLTIQHISVSTRSLPNDPP